MTDEVELLRRRLAREREARKQAEAIVERKSRDLFAKRQELERRSEELSRIVGSLQDANAKLAEAEASLRTESNFRERLIDSAHVIIVVLNSEGRVDRMNRMAEVLTGVSLAESRGQGGLELIFPEGDRSRVRAALQSLGSEGCPAALATGLSAADGLDREIEWRLTPLPCEASNRSLVLLVGHDITERARLFREVERLSVTDPLTGLHNRRHFDLSLAHEFERATRYHRPVSLVMIDIDHFKRVNDTYGHGVGDRVLEQVAAVCAKETRLTDVRARLGGEEFCLLLPETSAAAARVVAERLRLSVAALRFESEAGSFQVTASFGVAERGDSSDRPDAVLRRADEALYKAKHEGRNRVVVG